MVLLYSTLKNGIESIPKKTEYDFVTSIKEVFMILNFIKSLFENTSDSYGHEVSRKVDLEFDDARNHISIRFY